MKDITKNVYWERNIKTRRNPNIANQLIPKTTTDRFPHGAVTVRYNQITSSRPSASAYFYGKSYNNGGVLSDWPSSKLIVLFLYLSYVVVFLLLLIMQDHK